MLSGLLQRNSRRGALPRKNLDYVLGRAGARALLDDVRLLGKRNAAARPHHGELPDAGALSEHAKVKSIVSLAEVVAVSNPHLFDLRAGPSRAYIEAHGLYEKQEGFLERKEVGEPFDGPLRLNHYHTRSRSEFEAKVGMRNAAGRKDANKRRKVAAELDREPSLDETMRFVPVSSAASAATA